MLFQSYIFILLFLPLCLLGFWGLKRQKLLQLWLIAFPCGFTEQRVRIICCCCWAVLHGIMLFFAP